MRGQTTFAWNEAGTTLTGKKGETRLDWGDYHRWIESPELLLLFQSAMLYNLVPKRALSEGQLVEVRGLLEKAGVKRLSAR